MAYADYSYYTTEFMGNAIREDDFPRLSQRASRYVDGVTGGRAKAAAGDTLAAVQNAVCELAEVFQDEETMRSVAFSTDEVVASETVGSWSKSYGTRSVTSTSVDLIEKRKREIVQIYLSGFGLMTVHGQPVRKGWFP